MVRRRGLGGGSKGGAPMGGGSKISCFWFRLPPPVSLFLSLSGGLLVDFWCVWMHQGLHMCMFGVLGLSVKPQRPRRRVGGQKFENSTQQPQERLTCKTKLSASRMCGVLTASPGAHTHQPVSLSFTCHSVHSELQDQ